MIQRKIRKTCRILDSIQTLLTLAKNQDAVSDNRDSCIMPITNAQMNHKIKKLLGIRFPVPLAFFPFRWRQELEKGGIFTYWFREFPKSAAPSTGLKATPLFLPRLFAQTYRWPSEINMKKARN